MTVRPIRTYGDPVLRQPCREVTSFDESLAALVTDLLDTVDVPGRAGVAAPQIGISLRVFSYLVDDRRGYVVNPVLVETEGVQEGEEGCLSVPEQWADCPRADRAVVTGVDVEGRPVRVEGTGLLGRALQHECDHLDGMLYLDRLDPKERKRVLRDLRRADLDAELTGGPPPGGRRWWGGRPG